MSSMNEMREEIIRLKDDLEKARTERDRLHDQQEEILNQYEDDFESRKLAMEKNLQKQSKEIRAPLEALIQKLRTELTNMHRASTGDTCGWREHITIDEKGSKNIIYVNDETGQRKKDIPDIYDFALRSKHMEQAQADREGLIKARGKLKESETIRRKMDVKTNELRAEVATLKRKVKSWENVSSNISSSLQAFKQSFDLAHGNIHKAIDKFTSIQESLEQMNKLILKTAHVVDKSRREMNAQKSQILSNEEELNRLKQDCTISKDTLNMLETEMANKISIAIAPIKVEIANSSYYLMKEKAQRVHDKIHLASLWPPDWTLPSILIDYQSYNTKSLRNKAIQVERDLSHEKSTKCKPSSFLAEFSSSPQMKSISCITPIEKKKPAESDFFNENRDNSIIKRLQSKTVVKKSSWEGVVECQNQYYRNCETGEKCLYVPHERSINDDIWEFAKFNIVEASQIVVLYLNGIVYRSKSTDEDILPYDIHTVEDLAKGDNRWDFNTFFPKDQNDGSISKPIDLNESMSLQQLRSLIKDASKREEELTEQINKTRITIAKLSSKLLQFTSEQQFEKNMSDICINYQSCTQENIGTKTETKKSVNLISQVKNTSCKDKDNELSLSSKKNTSLTTYNSYSSDSSIDIVQCLVRKAVYAGFYDKSMNDSLQMTELNQYEKWLVSNFHTKSSKTKCVTDVRQNFESSSSKTNFNQNHEINIGRKYSNNEEKKDLSPYENMKEFNQLVDAIMLNQENSDNQHFNDFGLKDSITSSFHEPAFQASFRSIDVDDMETVPHVQYLDSEKTKYDSNENTSIENETFVHKSVINQLCIQIEKNQIFIDNDHENLKTKLKALIEDAKKDLGAIKNNASLMQNKIASLNFKLNGLNIKPTKPVPPQEPASIELFPLPSNYSDLNEMSNVHDEIFAKLNISLKSINKPDENISRSIQEVLLTKEQHNEITIIIEKKNQFLLTRYKESVKQYDELLLKYRKEIESFESETISRKQELINVKEQLWTNRLNYIHNRGMKRLCEQRLKWYQMEFIDEDLRGNDLQQMKQCNENVHNILRRKKIDSIETVSRLENNLRDMVQKKKWLEDSQMSATSQLEQIKHEKRKEGIQRQLELDIIRIRSSLIKEGERIRRLHSEQLDFVRQICRINREEKRNIEERVELVGLIESLMFDETLCLQSLHNAALVENNFCDYIDTEDPEKLDEKYLEEINWLGSECVTFRDEIMNAKKRVEIAIKARTLGRRREYRYRRWVNDINNKRSKENHADVEKERLVEKNEVMCQVLNRGMTTMRYQISNQRTKMDTIKRKLHMMICEIDSVKARNKQDIVTIRRCVVQTSQNLKHRITNLQNKIQEMKCMYKKRISNLYECNKELKKELNSKIQVLQKDNNEFSYLVETLRFDLSLINAKEDSTRMELSRLKSEMLNRIGTIKEEIKTEKNHSARLELIIAAMREAYHQQKRNLIKQKQEFNIIQREYEIKVRKSKEKELIQVLAIQELGMNVHEMFHFFMRRLTNLAGASIEYNNELREHGAIPLLSLFCNSPYNDLKLLAIQTLGRMGWNEIIERRIIIWDIFCDWKHWVAQTEENFREKIYNIDEWKDLPSNDLEKTNTVTSVPLVLNSSFRSKRRWAMRRRERNGNPNDLNQIMLGCNPNIVSSLFDLCGRSKIEKRHAVFVLSIISQKKRNIKLMVEARNLIPTAINLLQDDDNIIRGLTCVIVGNFCLHHQKWKRQFASQDGVNILLNLCQSIEFDLIENASAALRNIFLNYPIGGLIQSECEVIPLLIDLIKSEKAVNLIDNDQRSEIQANAIDCLSSLLQYDKKNVTKVCEIGIKPLILLCGSGNTYLRQKTGLVLGNIALISEQRENIGIHGGIEALVLLCGSEDEETEKNSFWALGNLAWEVNNQVRISKYLSEIITGCKSCHISVQINAVCCLANLVCYNDSICSDLTKNMEALDLIYHMCSDVFPATIQSSALRIIISLSYSYDNIRNLKVNSLLRNLICRCYSEDQHVQKWTTKALYNLSWNDEFKKKMISYGAIDALKYLKNSKYDISREYAQNVLDELTGATTSSEISEKKSFFNVKNLLSLCNSENCLVQKFAFDELGERIYLNPSTQTEMATLGGIEVTLNKCMQLEDHHILKSALGVLRSLCYNNVMNKDIVGSRGVEILTKICSNFLNKRPGSDEILESTLAAMLNVVIDHEKNSDKLYKIGLREIKSLTNMNDKNNIFWEQDNLGTSNIFLACILIRILQHQKKLFCKNCYHHQRSGCTCALCGHKLIFLNNVTEAFSTKRKQHVKYI